MPLSDEVLLEIGGLIGPRVHSFRRHRLLVHALGCVLALHQLLDAACRSTQTQHQYGHNRNQQNHGHVCVRRRRRRRRRLRRVNYTRWSFRTQTHAACLHLSVGSRARIAARGGLHRVRIRLLAKSAALRPPADTVARARSFARAAALDGVVRGRTFRPATCRGLRHRVRLAAAPVGVRAAIRPRPSAAVRLTFVKCRLRGVTQLRTAVSCRTGSAVARPEHAHAELLAAGRVTGGPVALAVDVRRTQVHAGGAGLPCPRGSGAQSARSGAGHRHSICLETRRVASRPRAVAVSAASRRVRLRAALAVLVRRLLDRGSGTQGIVHEGCPVFVAAVHFSDARGIGAALDRALGRWACGIRGEGVRPEALHRRPAGLHGAAVRSDHLNRHRGRIQPDGGRIGDGGNGRVADLRCGQFSVHFHPVIDDQRAGRDGEDLDVRRSARHVSGAERGGELVLDIRRRRRVVHLNVGIFQCQPSVLIDGDGESQRGHQQDLAGAPHAGLPRLALVPHGLAVFVVTLIPRLQPRARQCRVGFGARAQTFLIRDCEPRLRTVGRHGQLEACDSALQRLVVAAFSWAVERFVRCGGPLVREFRAAADARCARVFSGLVIAIVAGRPIGRVCLGRALAVRVLARSSDSAFPGGSGTGDTFAAGHPSAHAASAGVSDGVLVAVIARGSVVCIRLGRALSVRVLASACDFAIGCCSRACDAFTKRWRRDSGTNACRAHVTVCARIAVIARRSVRGIRLR
eukprot:COSAG04_NODE_382_length_15412_cov_4.959992_4_plen_745_part_00